MRESSSVRGGERLTHAEVEARGSRTRTEVGRVTLTLSRCQCQCDTLRTPPAAHLLLACQVRLRAAEAKALLAEVAAAAAAVRAAGRRGLILVGGDLNALREEFVYGNTDPFFASPAVRAPVVRIPCDLVISPVISCGSPVIACGSHSISRDLVRVSCVASAPAAPA
jgi:hypothetical protein